MKLTPSFFGAASGIASVASNFATKRAAIGKLRPDKLAVAVVNIGSGGFNYGWSSHGLWWFALRDYYTTKNPTCKGKNA
jgi:hypothetical protein